MQEYNNYYLKNNILTINSDPKTIKGLKKGYITAIIYLSPHKKSGKNLCAFASPGCIDACLDIAGRGKMNFTQKARLKRSHFFTKDKINYLNNVVLRISNFIQYAKNKNLIPVIRLNGTSDIPYENIKIKLNDLLQYKRLNNAKHKNVFMSFIQNNKIKESLNIMDIFKNIQFYDYSKYPLNKRPNAIKQANYDLTFSRSENNEQEALKYLKSGAGRSAFVFSHKLPKVYKGYKVINADKSDLRFLEDKNVISGLIFKGTKKDLKEGIKSNFVILNK